MKKTTKTTKKTATKAKAEKKPRAKKPPVIYSGAPVAATKLFRKRLEAFKNCIAFAWMIVNTTEGAGKITYCNSYGQQIDDTAPRPSWDPATYTFPLKEKVLAKKMEEYQEIEDRAEWPSFVVPAVTTKTRKAK